MGVTIGYSGLQTDPGLRAEALDWARAFATEMEWAFEEITIERPRGFLGHRVLEVPRIEGLSLLPHFASEPVPLLFLDTTGHLVDSILTDEGEGDIRLQDEVLTKTQFAGPAVHVEVCQFLAELRNRFVPGLTVDDETGFFESANLERLNQALDAGWDAIIEGISDMRDEHGSAFEVGGILVRVPAEDRPSGAESQIEPAHRQLLDELETWLMTRYGGFGLDFDRSEQAVEHLDLLMLEADNEGWFSEESDGEEAEQLVHAMGAAFGRTVESTLGAQWELDEEQGLVLAEVGSVGVIMNPFQIAAQRFAHGPAFAFAHQFDVHRELVRRLDDEGAD